MKPYGLVGKLDYRAVSSVGAGGAVVGSGRKEDDSGAGLAAGGSGRPLFFLDWVYTVGWRRRDFADSADKRL